MSAIPCPGSLIFATELTSERGKTLNGKLGIVRGGKTGDGCLEVEIIARRDYESMTVVAEKSQPSVCLKPANLICMDDNVDYLNRIGYPILISYLEKKASDLAASKNPSVPKYDAHGKQIGQDDAAHETAVELGNILAERFGIPGFIPNLADKVNRAVHLHKARNLPEATAIFQECVSEVSKSDPARSMIFFNYALALMDCHRFDDAMDAIDELKDKERDGQLREDTVQRLLCQCRESPREKTILERDHRKNMDLGSQVWVKAAARPRSVDGLDHACTANQGFLSHPWPLCY